MNLLQKRPLSVTLLIIMFGVYGLALQAQQVSIQLKNATLQELFTAIELQTAYRFAYRDVALSNSKMVTIAKSDVDVSTVLTQALASTNLTFSILSEKSIVIFEKKVAPSPKKQKAISGTVIDDKGDPVIGANVSVKETTIGTITDLDGKFELEASEGQILVVSYIGYSRKELPITQPSNYSVSIKEDFQSLEEIVVVGYGTMKKRDLTGAVANIKADNLNVQSNTNVMKALQGKLAGVEIVSRGGDPGNNSSVMIRGVGTFNNNSPLYIVDGMYMDNINFLNPNDIESIDVLKDASSAAIYGSRAANGVIIVSTKKGGDTSGIPTITASANLGVQNSTKKIDVLNAADWIEISTLSRKNASLPQLDMAANPQADVDWQKEVMRTGIQQNYNVSAQGGTTHFKYYVGTGYTDQQGTVRETDYRRLNLQVKSEFKKGIVTVGENILISQEQNYPITRATSRTGGVISSMLASVPTYSIYDETQDGGFNGPWGDAITYMNPLGALVLGRDKTENYKTYTNLYGIVDLPLDLQYKLNINADILGSYHYLFMPHYKMGLNAQNRNQLTETRGNSKNLLIENLLTFDKSFGDHKLTALAGYTFQQNHYRSLRGTGAFMPDGITVLDAATESSAGSSETVNALTSILARVFYSYKNRYLINVTYRRDGSSKFLASNRYGNFPSFSLGWNIREEAFMGTINWLDMFKLRGGWGVLGNQEVGSYLTSSDVTANINYLINGSTIWNGAFPKVFASPSIRWESTEMTNVGLDVAVLNSRLKFTGEYYIKNTTDILLNVPIPPSTGAANDPLKNAGQIRNRGVEWSVGWDDRVNKDLSYSINFIGSTLTNKVVKMGTGDQVIWSGTPIQSGAFTTKTIEGYPIGGFWLIETDGLFQSDKDIQAHSKDGKLIQPNAKPGDIRFKDHNKDGIINDDDRMYKGAAFPTLSLGLNGSIRYRDLDFSIGIQGNFGAKIYNSMRPDLEDVSKGMNYMSTVKNYWSSSNTDTNMPRLIWGDPNQNARTSSDRYLENGDYVRLTNLQLGYNIPRRFIPFLTAARVYVNGDNLLTLTSYTGYTPDVNASSALEKGIDRYTYPLPRTITFGLNISF